MIGKVQGIVIGSLLGTCGLSRGANPTGVGVLKITLQLDVVVVCGPMTTPESRKTFTLPQRSLIP